jgi:hypothetical protein
MNWEWSSPQTRTDPSVIDANCDAGLRQRKAPRGLGRPKRLPKKHHHSSPYGRGLRTGLIPGSSPVISRRRKENPFNYCMACYSHDLMT